MSRVKRFLLVVGIAVQALVVVVLWGWRGLVPEWKRGVHGACGLVFFCPRVGGPD